MDILEENIMHSFRLAKSDIIKLQEDVIKLSQTQERLMEFLDALRANQTKSEQNVKELKAKIPRKQAVKAAVVKAAKRASKVFVATKEGKGFHQTNCPFAQNIKPKNKITFKSRTKALNEGYKPCRCVK